MADHSPAAGHAHDEAHHPTWTTYWKIAVILTVITAVEVSAYYIPAWENSWVYVPSMLIMSAVKFWIVVMFTGPLLVAGITMVGLLFLFSKLVLRLGLLS